jgi:mRNA-degrading endonuclease HigB of HigAB toxin-antitoxin module
MYEKDCDTRTAIDYICSLSNVRFEAEKNFVHNKVEKKFQKKNGDLVLPEANTDHKRVFAYLRYTRNISQDVVQYALKNRLVYESKERHNAVFIGYSRNMEVKHAFLRGTITGVQFRGDVSGSDKAYGFSIEGDKSRVVVFEAPIDLLSYRTMYPNDKSNLLALGMVADMPLDKYLEEYPEIKNISLALDNDRAGFDASLDIKRKYKEKGYEVEDNRVVDELQKNNVKDVNELLCILPEFKELRKSKSR